MAPVRFVHCADIHLGYKQYGEQQRYLDFYNAFDGVVKYCIKNNVNFLLISGDLFHHKDLSPETLIDTTELFEKLDAARIKVFVVNGNHDKEHSINNMSWLEYLSEKGLGLVKLLNFGNNDNISYSEYGDDTIIAGLPYFGATSKKVLDKNFNKWESMVDFDPQMERFLLKENRILMFHTGVEGIVPSGGNLNAKDLLRFGKYFNYIALGHIHKPYIIEDLIFNPGSTESCDISQYAFKGGFYYITMEDGKITSKKHIITDHRTVIRISCDSYSKDGFILDNLQSGELLRSGKEAIIEITFTGINPEKPDKKLFSDIKKGPLAKFNPLVVKIVDNTTRPGEKIKLDNVKTEDIEATVIENLTQIKELSSLVLEVLRNQDEDAEVTYSRFEKYHNE
jgi:DNA repair exonuclease SbcCD nuclease subunit